MTLFISLLLFFIFGYVFLFLLVPRINLLVKLGLAFPTAFGVLSVVVYLYDIVGIQYTYASSMLALFLLTLIVCAVNIKNWKVYFKEYFPNEIESIKPNGYNLPWLFLFGCVCFVVYAITMKAMFWPTTAHDSIAGYDYFAKVVAAEGKLDNSIYDPLNYTYSYRTLYPPLIPIAYAFIYLCGLVSSKIVVSIYFISILLTFYGFLRYYTTHLNAILFTLLMSAIPEFLAMSALSLTNVPSVVYTTAGVVSLLLGIREKQTGFVLLSALMMGFAVFTRTETIVFAVAGGIVLLIEAIPKKKWSWIGVYATIPLLFFISWEIYLKYVWALTSEKQPFIYKIFWESDRFAQLWDLVMDVSFKTQMYGLTVYIFVIASLLSLWFIYKKKQTGSFLLFILLSWFLYIWVFYQLDIFEANKFTPQGKAYITSGYKRGFFNFCALFLFYTASIFPVRQFFKKYLP